MVNARVDEVAQNLLGTARDLAGEVTPEELEDTEFLHALDQQVLECATCGWWCETHEINEEGNCEDHDDS